MSTVLLTRLERFYAQIESTFGIVPNTAGTATLAGSNCFQAKSMRLAPKQAQLIDPSKTGSRTATPGVAGRRHGEWALDAPLRPNGVAGVKPDMDPIYQLGLGQAPTVNAGTAAITAASNASPIVVTATNTFSNDDVVTITGVTGNTAANGTWRITGVSGTAFTLDGSVGNGAYVSGGSASRVNVVYRLSDAIPSASLFSFRKDSAGGVGMQQRISIGSVAQRLVFHMNQDVANVESNGESEFIIDSKTFPTAEDAVQTGGLTTFPAEPGSPVTNGPIVAGFTGRFTIGGQVITKVNDATIAVDTGNDLPKNYFGTYYPLAPEGDVRKVSLSFNVDDDSSAGIQTLYQNALDFAQIDGWFQIGNQPGSITVCVMKGIQLALPELNDQSSRRWQKTFAESMAHGSSLTALNELAVWMC